MRQISILGILLMYSSIFNNISFAQISPKPSEVQYKWREQECIMFLHFAPTTWSNIEQNDHTVSLDRINP